jgi:outer membrane biosynthesis protein TonB
MNLTKSQKKGVVATVIFHAGLLFWLLYMFFKIPYTPPQEEGFLVDFGNSTTGLGQEEPSAAQAPEVETAKPAPVTKSSSKPRSSAQSKEKEEEDIVTQEYEKTVAINKRKAIKEKNLKLKEIQKQKALEQLQAKEEEIAREQKEAEENRIKQEQVKKIGAINSKAKNAFGGGKTDNGSKSTGQGNTYGAGNQGSLNGTPGANQYGLGGGDGKGISYSLSGRNARSLPKPSFPGNEAGIVVVEVTVDKYGKVTKAISGVRGSNTADADLLEAAKRAALAAMFNSDPNAPAFQKGTITYHFILQ